MVREVRECANLAFRATISPTLQKRSRLSGSIDVYRTLAINRNHETAAATRNAPQTRRPYEAAAPPWVTWRRNSRRIYPFSREKAKYTAPGAFSLRGESAFGAKMAMYTATSALHLGAKIHLEQKWQNIPRQMHFHFGTKCIWRRNRIFIFGLEM